MDSDRTSSGRRPSGRLWITSPRTRVIHRRGPECRAAGAHCRGAHRTHCDRAGRHPRRRCRRRGLHAARPSSRPRSASRSAAAPTPPCGTGAHLSRRAPPCSRPGCAPVPPSGSGGPHASSTVRACCPCMWSAGRPRAGSCRSSAGVLTIGRGADCDLVLPDDGASRMHAALSVDGHTLTVRDLGSTNGTLVDGEPAGPDGQRIGPGQLVRIGDSLLSVAGPDRSARRADVLRSRGARQPRTTSRAVRRRPGDRGARAHRLESPARRPVGHRAAARAGRRGDRMAESLAPVPALRPALAGDAAVRRARRPVALAPLAAP